MVQVITLECGRLGEAAVFVLYDCMLFKTFVLSVLLAFWATVRKD